MKQKRLFNTVIILLLISVSLNIHTYLKNAEVKRRILYRFTNQLQNIIILMTPGSIGSSYSFATLKEQCGALDTMLSILSYTEPDSPSGNNGGFRFTAVCNTAALIAEKKPPGTELDSALAPHMELLQELAAKTTLNNAQNHRFGVNYALSYSKLFEAINEYYSNYSVIAEWMILDGEKDLLPFQFDERELRSMPKQ